MTRIDSSINCNISTIHRYSLKDPAWFIRWSILFVNFCINSKNFKIHAIPIRRENIVVFLRHLLSQPLRTRLRRTEGKMTTGCEIYVAIPQQISSTPVPTWKPGFATGSLFGTNLCSCRFVMSWVEALCQENLEKDGWTPFFKPNPGPTPESTCRNSDA